MKTTKNFYERYWLKDGKPIPEDDATSSDRKRLLKLSLELFLKKRNGNQKILDAGCGSGEFVIYMKQLGFDVTGMDLAEGAIQIAKRIGASTHFVVGSAEEGLPFSSGQFDAIWNTEVIEHLFDIHATFSEFNRILRVGGIVILTTPFHGFLKNLAIAMIGFEKHYNPYLSHIRFFTKRTLTESLTRAGFQPVFWRGIGRVWPVYKSLFVVAQKVKSPAPAPEIVG